MILAEYTKGWLYIGANPCEAKFIGKEADSCYLSSTQPAEKGVAQLMNGNVQRKNPGIKHIGKLSAKQKIENKRRN